MFATSTMNVLASFGASEQPASERESMAMLLLAVVVSFVAWLAVFAVAAVPMIAFAGIRWALARFEAPAEPAHETHQHG